MNMNQDMLRLVEAISREKQIDREIIFQGIEQALTTAAKRRYGPIPPTIQIHRESGEIICVEEDFDIDPKELGRIAAQTAKQVIIQKIREAERDQVFDEYQDKLHAISTGHVLRQEGPHLIVGIGRVEAILPRGEQVRSERYQPGNRIRAFLKSVEKKGQKVKIFLSRTSPDFVHKLFEMEVPEIADGSVEIKEITREPGFRTKIAVHSLGDRIDCVGACVGVRGARIKNIVDELNGEKVDIIRWEADTEQFIRNALKPAEVFDIALQGPNGESITEDFSARFAEISAEEGEDALLPSDSLMADIASAAEEDGISLEGDTHPGEEAESAVEESGTGEGTEKEGDAADDLAGDSPQFSSDHPPEEEESTLVRKAIVYVLPDQLSLAIGRGGQNVRLASKLTGWEIDIVKIADSEESELIPSLEALDLPDVPEEAGTVGEAGPKEEKTGTLVVDAKVSTDGEVPVENGPRDGEATDAAACENAAMAKGMDAGCLPEVATVPEQAEATDAAE